MTALPGDLFAPQPDDRLLDVRAANLNAAYFDLDAEAMLERALYRDFRGRIAVVSSFGAESAVLLDLVAAIDPTTPVVFLDTGRLFWETRNYRDVLATQLGLTDVRSVEPSWFQIARHDADGTLHRRDPDLCCHIRKVLPLEEALAGFDAWITGRKRFQGGERVTLPLVEHQDGRLKINPLARWSPAEITARFVERDLPCHPLATAGFTSVGCQPCTTAAGTAGAPRAGRWAGTGKTECGIHKSPRAGDNGVHDRT